MRTKLPWLKHEVFTRCCLCTPFPDPFLPYFSLLASFAFLLLQPSILSYARGGALLMPQAAVPLNRPSYLLTARKLLSTRYNPQVLVYNSEHVASKAVWGDGGGTLHYLRCAEQGVWVSPRPEAVTAILPGSVKLVALWCPPQMHCHGAVPLSASYHAGRVQQGG